MHEDLWKYLIPYNQDHLLNVVTFLHCQAIHLICFTQNASFSEYLIIKQFHGQILFKILCQTIKFYWNTALPICLQFVAAFTLQWQSSVVGLPYGLPSKIFTIWAFRENFYLLLIPSKDGTTDLDKGLYCRD